MTTSESRKEKLAQVESMIERRRGVRITIIRRSYLSTSARCFLPTLDSIRTPYGITCIPAVHNATIETRGDENLHYKVKLVHLPTAQERSYAASTVGGCDVSGEEGGHGDDDTSYDYVLSEYGRHVYCMGNDVTFNSQHTAYDAMPSYTSIARLLVSIGQAGLIYRGGDDASFFNGRPSPDSEKIDVHQLYIEKYTTDVFRKACSSTESFNKAVFQFLVDHNKFEGTNSEYVVCVDTAVNHVENFHRFALCLTKKSVASFTNLTLSSDGGDGSCDHFKLTAFFVDHSEVDESTMVVLDTMSLMAIQYDTYVRPCMLHVLGKSAGREHVKLFLRVFGTSISSEETDRNLWQSISALVNCDVTNAERIVKAMRTDNSVRYDALCTNLQRKN